MNPMVPLTPKGVAALRNGLLLSMVLIVCTLVVEGLGPLALGGDVILLIYMLGVLVVSVYTPGYVYSAVSALCSTVLVNYFFTEPVFDFSVYGAGETITLGLFLAGALLASRLAGRMRAQMIIAQENEETARRLYEVSRVMNGLQGEEEICSQASDYLHAQLGQGSRVEVRLGAARPAESPVPGAAFTQAGPANAPQDAAPGEAAVRLPSAPMPGGPYVFAIPGHDSPIGSLLVSTPAPMDMKERWLAVAVCAQMGLALERDMAYREKEALRVTMEQTQLKNDLLRSIGHDLRSPLTGISGASAYMTERADTLTPASISRLAGDIHEQTLWLTAMVENVLNMTRFAGGDVRLNLGVEVVDDVVNEAVEHAIGLASGRLRVNLSGEVVTLPMDAQLVSQALTNLLNNAVHHTPGGTPVELNVAADDDTVTFTVEDGGAGIPPARAARVFDEFVSTNEKRPDGSRGLGLGLSICKAVAEAHGGTITVGASHLGGAAFHLTLPRRAPAKPEEAI